MNSLRLTCLFCSKANGSVKYLDGKQWMGLRKAASERSEENLGGAIADVTKKVLEYNEVPTSEGYHGLCYRNYVSMKPRKRRLNDSLKESEYLPAVSNTIVAQIFSVASRTFADLSDLIMQLHPQEDLNSRHAKYTQNDVDLLYKAVEDFGENIKDITENLRQRHADQMRNIVAQNATTKPAAATTSFPSSVPSAICSPGPSTKQTLNSASKRPRISTGSFDIQKQPNVTRMQTLIIKPGISNITRTEQDRNIRSTNMTGFAADSFNLNEAEDDEDSDLNEEDEDNESLDNSSNEVDDDDVNF